MRPVGFDLETELIGPGAILPRPICATLAWRAPEGIQAWGFGNGDPDFESAVRATITNPDNLLVTQRGAYDFGCLVVHYPRLAPAIFAAYAAGRVTDVAIREKLLRVSTTGRIAEEVTADGDVVRVRYSLAALEMRYTGVDRSAEKESDVRLTYYTQDGRRFADFDPAYRDYALRDPIGTLRVYEHQQIVQGSTATEDFQAAADHALLLLTHRGLQVDAKRVAAQLARVVQERDPERLPLLVSSGILELRDERPHANGSRDHVEGCDHFGCECAERTPKGNRRHAKGCPRPKCDCPPRLVPAKPPKVCARELHSRILATCEAHGLAVVLTDKGQEELGCEKLRPDEVPRDEKGKPLYVGSDQEFINELAAHDPVLREYRHRKRLDKLAQFLEKLSDAIEAGYPIVHPNYDVLKETARTASFGTKRGTVLGEPGHLYPSIHIQGAPNPPKKSIEDLEFLDDLDVRLCFEPRPGMVFVGSDYSALELVTAAQATYELLEVPHGIESHHRRLINAGVDLHGYLGSGIASQLGKDKGAQKFRRSSSVARAIRLGDRLGVYREFTKRKASGDDADRKFFKLYRTTAKPAGLGYLGMLGERKLAYKLAPQYGLDITVEEAGQLKQLWLETYPEMPHFVKWLDGQRDHTGYWYECCGFVRRGCTYNAAANGTLMQTRGAFGAKRGCLIDMVRASYDPSQGSFLYGRFWPVAFIHDEILGETPDVPEAHWVAQEVSRIMVEGLRYYCPDVECAAEPCLGRRWSKAMEPVRDDAGLLIPWEPEVLA